MPPFQMGIADLPDDSRSRPLVQVESATVTIKVLEKCSFGGQEITMCNGGNQISTAMLYFFSTAAQSVAALTGIYATFVAFRTHTLWDDIERDSEIYMADINQAVHLENQIRESEKSRINDLAKSSDRILEFHDSYLRVKRPTDDAKRQKFFDLAMKRMTEIDQRVDFCWWVKTFALITVLLGVAVVFVSLLAINECINGSIGYWAVIILMTLITLLLWLGTTILLSAPFCQREKSFRERLSFLRVRLKTNLGMNS